MSAPQAQVAAVDGLKTYKSANAIALGSGAFLDDSSLLTVLGLTAFPTGFYGAFDIKVVTGTVYFTVNNDAATADAMPLDSGEKYGPRNCMAMAGKMRFFASAAYDMRIMLYAGGTP